MVHFVRLRGVLLSDWPAENKQNGLRFPNPQHAGGGRSRNDVHVRMMGERDRVSFRGLSVIQPAKSIQVEATGSAKQRAVHVLWRPRRGSCHPN
jgi:hypothetical protein